MASRLLSLSSTRRTFAFSDSVSLFIFVPPILRPRSVPIGNAKVINLLVKPHCCVHLVIQLLLRQSLQRIRRSKDQHPKPAQAVEEQAMYSRLKRESEVADCIPAHNNLKLVE